MTEEIPLTPAEHMAHCSSLLGPAKKRGVKPGTPSKVKGHTFVCELSALRKGLKLSQVQVAAVIGITSVRLSQIEHGESPSLTHAMSLARFFGKPVEELWREHEQAEATQTERKVA